jgi:endonuclease YncB( thermonuclease family)
VNTLRVLAFAVATLAQAPIPAAAEIPVAAGRVVSVIDGDTVTLEGGAEVRLVGIQAPKLPLGRPNFTAWPLADEAKRALESLCLNRNVTLSYGGRETDRYGRLLAHVHTASGAWTQGEMLALGLARVYTFADNRARAAEMLAVEEHARAARRGIWAHPFYAVRQAAEPARIPTGSFELVEGKVLAAAVVQGRGYLNFGAERRSDFTVMIAPKSLRSFGGAAELQGYSGHRVRARGWVERRDGPRIEATHREQIERLD